MQVFSASIEAFLVRLTICTKEILRADFGVRVARTRFHTADDWTWPIIIVAIDDRSRLGYFDATRCSIGIHKCLMYSAKEQVLKNLLRHELAHYFTHIEHGDSTVVNAAHGAEFSAVCAKYDLGPRVRSATMDIREENDAIEGDLESERVIAKIQKLMSLARSDNENEAELATLRANELMTKHNLDAVAASSGAQAEIEYRVKRVISCKRSTPRISAISQILEEFFVYPVFAREGLEITGTAPNLDNAEYIASYLDRELALLWKRTRAKNPNLKQRSFMAALATSYTTKLRGSRAALPDHQRRALVVMNAQLEQAAQGVYGGGLRSGSSSYRECKISASFGAEAGARLDIKQGVGGTTSMKLLGG